MKERMKILLIEDDADDVELLQEALSNNGLEYDMHVINDGAEVAPYLKRMTESPDIIVMDLNLPKVHGKDILKGIKSSPLYSGIPVVVLTTSSSVQDKNYTLGLGANDFLIKPTNTSGLYHVVSVIVNIVAGADKG